MQESVVGGGSPNARSEGLELSLGHAIGLAVASGVLYFLAFPGLDLWPFGFVALVPLRLALVGQSPKRAFGLGWLTGLTLSCFGFYWLVGMLARFSGFPTAVCVFFALVVNAYQGLRMGAFAWLFVRAERRGWPAGLVWIAALPATELVFPVIFWWSFGAVLHPVSALTQIADLAGILGVCALAAAGNWALAEWALAVWQRRRLPLRKTAPYWLAPLAACAYGALRIAAVDRESAAAAHSELGLVQLNLSLMGKRNDPGESLRRHLNATAALVARTKPELVLWSETVVTRRVLLPGAGELEQRALAADVGVPLLFGVILRENVNDARGHAYYNSALIADAQGVVHGRYDKQDLVPFSEKMPFGRELPILYRISPNSGKFEPSDHPGSVPFGAHRIGVTICNDDVRTGPSNHVLADGRADLLTNLTNDAWFGDTTEPWIHLALAKFRAIEHRRFFVRVTNSGVSAFIDPVGRVAASTGTFREEALAWPIAWLRGRTVYDFVGDYPYWLLAAFVGFAAFRTRPGRKLGPSGSV
jgi:apolipoprotein N-acyltransferase